MSETPCAGTVVGHIDITMTWTGVLPALIAGITHGTAEGKRLTLQALETMAKAADAAGATTDLLAGLSAIAGLPDDKPGERGGLKRARHIAGCTIAKAEGRS